MTPSNILLEEKRREEKRREEKRREERVVRADLCAQNFREAISQTHPVRGDSAFAVRLFFVSPRSAKGGGVYA